MARARPRESGITVTDLFAVGAAILSVYTLIKLRAAAGGEAGVDVSTATHLFNLRGAAPHISTAGGYEILGTADNVPILNVPDFERLANWAVSVGWLTLNKGGVLEPHWHPNCVEIGYCTSGSAAVTIFNGAPNIVFDAFTVNPGDIFFVPRGFTHDIENIGDGGQAATFLLGWNNERPQTVGLSQALEATSTGLLNSTFSMSGTFWDKLRTYRQVTDHAVIALKPSDAKNPTITNTRHQETNTGIVSQKVTAVDSVSTTSPYKYALDSSKPSVNTSGGTDKEGNATNFPILAGAGLAFFSIVLQPFGIREPHWHPNAAELHFVLSGNTHWFVQNPDGSVEDADASAGEFFYAPPGYFHYFANTDPNNRLHIVAIFTNEEPQDVGLSGSLSSYSNSVLGATFNQPASAFTALRRFSVDEGIVGRGSVPASQTAPSLLPAPIPSGAVGIPASISPTSVVPGPSSAFARAASVVPPTSPAEEPAVLLPPPTRKPNTITLQPVASDPKLARRRIPIPSIQDWLSP
jgi:oxalate decarboxylase